MDLFEWLPMPFWEGPPFPRAFGIYWPFAKENPEEREEPAAYTNDESIEFPDGFDPVTFMPNRIVVHRRYKKRGD
jgi:hypothetical protein